MVFSDRLKLTVRRAAAFRCCMCEKVGVEVHHIIPQEEGGPDTFENAAPLCAGCHCDIGDNRRKRKQIKQMRDWWYDVARKKWPLEDSGLGELTARIDQLVATSEQNQGHVDALKDTLLAYMRALIGKLEIPDVQDSATRLMNAIPLDTGYAVTREQIATEGRCTCEREACVDHESKTYCYWPKHLSTWVVTKRLYWRCYDEIIVCPKCNDRHKRGHVGKLGVCAKPFNDQENQED